MITMAQKNLHELLEQDQEPFLLKNYIADRRSRLKNHLRRRRPNDGGVLHIPEPTGAQLLEAAMRIHNQSNVSGPKPKSKGNKVSVGLFDSIFKRLGNRSNGTSVKKSRGISIGAGNSSSYSCGNSQRHSTTVWSEKSLDLESCCTSSSTSQESTEHIPATDKKETVTSTSTSTETQYFCSSPQSPFRFSLFRTPEFSSPEASSGRHSKEGNGIREAKTVEIYDDEDQVRGGEEEKEQCSPVSVLEPLFQDEEDKVEDYEPEMECYAIMQKAKHQLLEKLRRFERLAQLDPSELDKTLFEDEYDDVNEFEEEEEQQQQQEDCFLVEVISESGLVVKGIKRLVFDLIEEEEEEVSEGDEVTKRVRMRLEEWNEAKRESIDMMVETDLRRERSGTDENLLKDVGKEIEFAILGDLIEEFVIVC